MSLGVESDMKNSLKDSMLVSFVFEAGMMQWLVLHIKMVINKLYVSHQVEPRFMSFLFPQARIVTLIAQYWLYLHMILNTG